MKRAQIVSVLALFLVFGVPASWSAPAKKFQRSRHTSDETQMTVDRRTLVLSTGEDRPVDINFEIADEKKQISTADSTVVIPWLNIIGNKTQLVFKPLKEGVSSVTVRDNDGEMRLIFTVRVTSNNLLRTAGEIRQILQDVEGLEVRVIGKKVIVEGDIFTPDDYGMVQRVIHDEAYEKVVLDKTKLSAMALTVLARKIQEEISVFAPEARTRVVNGVIFLEGTVESIDTANRAATVAQYYLPEAKPVSILEKADPNVQKVGRRQTIYNALIIRPPAPKKLGKLLRVRFDFVQLSKDYAKIFSFKWAPGFSATDNVTIGSADGAGIAAAGGTFSGTLSQLFPRLQWLSAANYARVLKTANVVVRNGEPAVVKDATQYTFPLQAANGSATTQTRDVGFEANVTPKLVGQTEDVELDIKLSQSAPQAGQTANGVPVIETHVVNTKLYVKSGESAALGGVDSSGAKTSFNQDPGSGSQAQQGDTPLVNLIHAKNFKKDRGQFVVFVTPQIVENASDGTDDLKKNFRIKVK